MEYAEFFKVKKSLFNEEGHLLSMNLKTLRSVRSTDLGKYLVELMRDDLNRIVIDYSVNGFQDELIGDEIWIGYAMKDGWKFELINHLVENINVDNCDKFIGNYGIRKACKVMLNNGFGDELPDLTTDSGIQQLMFHILYDIIIIDSEVKKIERDEYDKFFGGEIEEEEEEEDEEEDEYDEEDFEAIVPITDEAFDRSGGRVAICA